MYVSIKCNHVVIGGHSGWIGYDGHTIHNIKQESEVCLTEKGEFCFV